MDNQDLFGNYKYCEICRRPLPLNYNGNICPNCVQHQLFQKVKEYIRQNDVTEYQVADHFQIPLSRVKQWIREGRIEYKEDHLNSRVTMHCQKCGEPISFGILCSKCLKQQNMSVHSAAQPQEPQKMRYLENPERKK